MIITCAYTAIVDVRDVINCAHFLCVYVTDGV